MNGLSFLLTDSEISFEDALPTYGLAWLVGRCVCVIPYYSLAHTSHTFSPHTLTGHHGASLLFARLLGQGTQHAHPSWSGCQNICRTVSVVKIFSTGCTQRAGGREGDETRLGSCGDCQRTNGPQTHPYGCPVPSQTRRRLKGHAGPRQKMWCLTAATYPPLI